MAEVISNSIPMEPPIELDDLSRANPVKLDVQLPAQEQLSNPAPSYDDETTRREEAVALHPVDRGFHAWLFVFCAFVLESIVWGFPFRYDVSTAPIH